MHLTDEEEEEEEEEDTHSYVDLDAIDLINNGGGFSGVSTVWMSAETASPPS